MGKLYLLPLLWQQMWVCSVCRNATWQCAIRPECSGGILGEVHCPHNQVYRHHDSSSCTLTCATYDIGCPANLSPHDACGCPTNTVMSANVCPLRPRLSNQLPASLRQLRTYLSISDSPSPMRGTSSIGFIDSLHSSSITPSLFHPRLKTCLFCKSLSL